MIKKNFLLWLLVGAISGFHALGIEDPDDIPGLDRLWRIVNLFEKSHSDFPPPYTPESMTCADNVQEAKGWEEKANSGCRRCMADCIMHQINLVKSEALPAV